MSSRTIASRLSWIALLAALAPACSGGSGGSAVPTTSSEDPIVIKISYFRALQEPKTRRLEPHFRVVMSDSWKDRMGESPREPLARAAPGKVYSGFQPDAQMVRWR